MLRQPSCLSTFFQLREASLVSVDFPQWLTRLSEIRILLQIARGNPEWGRALSILQHDRLFHAVLRVECPPDEEEGFRELTAAWFRASFRDLTNLPNEVSSNALEDQLKIALERYASPIL